MGPTSMHDPLRLLIHLFGRVVHRQTKLHVEVMLMQSSKCAFSGCFVSGRDTAIILHCTYQRGCQMCSSSDCYLVQLEAHGYRVEGALGASPPTAYSVLPALYYKEVPCSRVF